MKYFFLFLVISTSILAISMNSSAFAEGGGGLDCPESSGTYFYLSGTANYEENPFDEGKLAILYCQYQTDVIDENNLEIFADITAIYHMIGEISQELIDEYGCGSVLGEQYASDYISGTTHFASVAYSSVQLIDAAENIMSQIKEKNLASPCIEPEKESVAEIVKEVIKKVEENPDDFVPEEIIIVQKPIVQENLEIILPDWIKNNAGWWATDLITDQDFSLGIEFMIKEGFIKIPITEAAAQTSSEIPGWVKNNASWWSDGLISDEEFVNGLQFLISVGIISAS